MLRRILIDSPEDCDALARLGLVLAREGRTNAAVHALTAAVALDPSNADLHYNLAAAFCSAQNWEAAIGPLERCLDMDPAHSSAWEVLPWALLEAGRLDEAAAASTSALSFTPESSLLHRSRGRIFSRLGDVQQAAESFAIALRIDPGDNQALVALAGLFTDIGEDSLALELNQQLATRFPASSPAWRQVAASAIRVGDITTALHAQSQAILLGPSDHGLISAYLRTLIQDPASTADSLHTAHRRYFPDSPRRSFSNSIDPDRPLRIGIISGEFDGGTAEFFLAPALRLSNLYRYNTRKLSALSDLEIHQRIVLDQIDILLDVSGLLPRNRFGVFAARSAPVQVAYPRYPASTGLDAIDYFVTDPWAGPPGGGRQLVLPGGYLAYLPPSETPEIPPLPAIRNGYITFGYFVGPMRLNAFVIDQIAAILRAVAGSRLLIHYLVPDFDRPGRFARQRIEDAFAARGIAPFRLRFVGELDFQSHLALLCQTDLALDSFPYNGQTNTCECLWMGVPVVTLAGDRFSARVSSAILHRVGLPDWVAASAEEYVQLAIAKASNTSALATLRASLRSQLSRSPLLDVARVTRELEVALRLAWRDWCQRQNSLVD